MPDPLRRNVIGGTAALAVAGTSRPGLCMLVAGGRRMLLRQGRTTVLLGSVERDHCGVHVHRTDAYRSPVPPVGAAEARRAGPQDVPGWAGRWAHRWADVLRGSSTGPLYDGAWLLRGVQLPPYCLHAELIRDRDAYLDWLSGWNGIVPLLPLPGPGTGRVKAYRKLAREGLLPPVLLLAVSGFDGYVLLDGHARLVAAHLEGLEPAVLVLGTRLRPDEERAALDLAGTRFEQIERLWRATPLAYRAGVTPALDSAARTYAAACVAIPQEAGRTRAWQLPGGEAAWRSIAAAEAADWWAAVDDEDRQR